MRKGLKEMIVKKHTESEGVATGDLVREILEHLHELSKGHHSEHGNKDRYKNPRRRDLEYRKASIQSS